MQILINELKKLNVRDYNKLVQYVDFCLTNNTGEHIVGKTEHHHILPKAKTLPFVKYKNLTKYEWNGVHLTYENHYIAHSILAEAVSDTPIIYAWHRLNMSVNKDGLINASLYKELRERHIEIVKERSSLANSGKVDVLCDGKIIKIFKDDPRYLSGELQSHHKGKILSTETKEKISSALSGVSRTPHSDETKKKISNSNIGKIMSEESKKKISNNRKGKGTGAKEIVTCPYCDKTGGKPAMIRFHFDNCKMLISSGI